MSDNYYLIKNQGTGLVLAVEQGNTTTATGQVIVTEENNQPNQHWKINQSGLIQSRLNDYALELGIFSWEFWLGCVYLAPVKSERKQDVQQWKITQPENLKNKSLFGFFGLATYYVENDDNWGLIAYPIINESNSKNTEKWQLVPVKAPTGKDSQKTSGLRSWKQGQTLIKNGKIGGQPMVMALDQPVIKPGYMNWQRGQTNKAELSVGHPSCKYGHTMAIHGNLAIIGAPEANIFKENSGAAYIFQFENGSWQYKQRLIAKDMKEEDNFGWSVAICDKYAIVGTYYEDIDNRISGGAAYVFQYEQGLWQQTQKLMPSNLDECDRFGMSVAISENYAIVGADFGTCPDENSGLAYVFALNNGEWQEIQKLTPDINEPGILYGNSIAISDEVAMISAPYLSAPWTNSGAVYVYQLQNGQWQQQQIIVPDDLGIQNLFGNSISISENVAIIGAFYGNAPGKPSSGAAYIFHRKDGLWQIAEKLQPSDLGTYDFFGYDVAVSGDVAIVGSPHSDNSGMANVGSAYIYQYHKGKWHLRQKLQPSELKTSGLFGSSVAIMREAALIGTPDHRNSAGTVYSFEATAKF
jgi:hypothetical protein